jgi:UDP-2,3-diacylglucosamine hydrolase
MEMSKCIFLSDLHIENDGDIDKFLKFIKRSNADAIFLIGDIFEFLAYDNLECMKKYEEVIKELRDISLKGRRVIFVEGNHDFALNGRFVSGSKIEISHREYIFYLDGKKTVLVHGDVFFMNRVFRKILRSSITKKVVETIPDRVIMKFGFWFSSLGKNKRKIVKNEMVERQMKYLIEHYGDVEIFVSGHLHTPILKRIFSGNRYFLWVNPGGPDNICEYSNGEFSIKPY